MKFDYAIFPAERAILARLTGRFTLAGLIAGATEMWSDEGYSPSFDGIVDLTSADLGVAMEDYRALIQYLRESPHTSTGRWAAIAHSPLATACGFIYRNATHHSFEVFSTREVACAFVDFDIIGDELLAPGTVPKRR